jgi:hypothetical protein
MQDPRITNDLNLNGSTKPGLRLALLPLLLLLLLGLH